LFGSNFGLFYAREIIIDGKGVQAEFSMNLNNMKKIREDRGCGNGEFLIPTGVDDHRQSAVLRMNEIVEGFYSVSYAWHVVHCASVDYCASRDCGDGGPTLKVRET
jgi:hypothetical protein